MVTVPGSVVHNHDCVHLLVRKWQVTVRSPAVWLFHFHFLIDWHPVMDHHVSSSSLATASWSVKNTRVPRLRSSFSRYVASMEGVAERAAAHRQALIELSCLLGNLWQQLGYRASSSRASGLAGLSTTQNLAGVTRSFTPLYFVKMVG